MKLPNGNRAVVPVEKLVDYALDRDHPVGQHKAHVFARALGLTADNASELSAALLTAAANCDATLGDSDNYGQRYVIDFPMTTAVGSAIIRSAWIVRSAGTEPQLLSCYVLKEGPT